MRRLATDASADSRAELIALLEARLDPGTCAKAKELLTAMAEDDVDPPRRPEPAAPSQAMDKRHYAMDSGDAFTRMRDLTAAEREVAPHVGEILGADSAAGVFREALSRLGASAPRDIHPSALPILFRTTARNRHHAAMGGRPVLAHDAASNADFSRRFPGADRIRNLG